MTDHVRLVPLAEQIGAVDRARLVVAGGARVPSRAAERDYDARALAAALRTLRWLRAHEYEVRSAVRRDAQAEVAARAAEDHADLPAKTAKPCAFPLARRAAMRCANGAFQKFLDVETAEGAAEAVRSRCGVKSRKDFDRDADARARWLALDAEFGAWLRCAEALDR